MIKEIFQLKRRFGGHRDVRSLMSPYLDGELSDNIKANIDLHLNDCVACSDELAKLSFARNAIMLINIPEPQVRNLPRSVFESPSQTAFRRSDFRGPTAIFVAAAAVLIVALVGALFLVRYRSDPKTAGVPIEIVKVSGAPMYRGLHFDRVGVFDTGGVLTTDQYSKALIKLTGVGQVETGFDTQVELAENGFENQQLLLRHGKLYASITAPPRVFSVRSFAVTAIDLGCAYSIEVTSDNETIIEVTSGWVALSDGDSEMLVPAGTVTRTKLGEKPGIPFHKDATEGFRTALSALDGNINDTDSLFRVMAEAKSSDAISLWFLLSKVPENSRKAVMERLNLLVPKPNDVSNEAIFGLDREALEKWRLNIEYATNGFDPADIDFGNGSVSYSGNLKIARFAHSSTLLPNGTVLVVGGSGENGEILDSGEIIDPVTGRSNFVGNMSVKRAGHSATLLRDGKVLIAGGSGADPFVGAQPDAELFDPVTGRFEKTGSMNYPRLSHQATLLIDGSVLITGGIIGNQTGDPPAEIYDPLSGKFFKVGHLHYPRFDHTATLLADGSVLIAGGGRTINGLIEILDKAEVFIPGTNEFRLVGSLEIPRHKHSAVLLPNGNILIFGGSDVKLWNGMITSAEVFDPNTNTFALTGNMSTARYKIRDAAVLLQSGKVLIAGGGEQLEIYDPVKKIFVPVREGLMSARFSGTATLLADGRVILIGGYSEAPDKQGIRILPDSGIWKYSPK